jgi:hypothetical protein
MGPSAVFCSDLRASPRRNLLDTWEALLHKAVLPAAKEIS